MDVLHGVSGISHFFSSYFLNFIPSNSSVFLEIAIIYCSHKVKTISLNESSYANI